MFEYTTVHPLTLNGRTYGVGEKITDPNLMPLLELPQYARSVSRHFTTTPPPKTDDAKSEEKVDDKKLDRPRLPAPSDVN